MPIIVAVLGTLVLLVAYYFVRLGGIDIVRQRRERRKVDELLTAKRESARDAPMRAVDDPRNAAAILMLLLVVRPGTDPTDGQIAAIKDKLRGIFHDERELAEGMAQAQALAQQAHSFDQAARVFADLFYRHLSDDERRELVGMLEDVVGPGQAAVVEAFRPLIGLARTRRSGF